MCEGWDIHIQYAVIDGAIDISATVLERDDKGKYIIAGRVAFWEATFNRCVSFKEASFNQFVSFSNVIFNQYADFSGAIFNRVGSFGMAGFNQYVNFREASFNHPARFAKVVILENTTRRGLRNYIVAPLIVWLIAKIRRGQSEKQKKALEERLKRTVTDVYDINTATVMDTSSNPYLKRYIDDEQWINSWRERGGRGKEALFLVWEGMSHCGRSIGLWAAWSLFFILFFRLFSHHHPTGGQAGGGASGAIMELRFSKRCQHIVVPL